MLGFHSGLIMGQINVSKSLTLVRKILSFNVLQVPGAKLNRNAFMECFLVHKGLSNTKI